MVTFESKRMLPCVFYWFGLPGYKTISTKKIVDMGSDLKLKIISIL
jgi:hypothetical protein